MASKKESSPASYADVKYVLDLAIHKPGLKYVLKTPGAATNFKQRCNKFRNLMREMAAETYNGLPGFRAETAYDPLVIRQIDAEGKPSGQGCILRFDHQELQGTLIDPETGEELPIPGVTDTITDA